MHMTEQDSSFCSVHVCLLQHQKLEHHFLSTLLHATPRVEAKDRDYTQGLGRRLPIAKADRAVISQQSVQSASVCLLCC